MDKVAGDLQSHCYFDSPVLGSIDWGGPLTATQRERDEEKAKEKWKREETWVEVAFEA